MSNTESEVARGAAAEIRPRKDQRGVDLISDVLPLGRLWYGEPNAVSNASGYATHRSRSHHAVIRVYDGAGNVIETHEHKGDFKNGRFFFNDAFEIQTHRSIRHRRLRVGSCQE